MGLFTLPPMTTFTGSSPAPGKLAFAWGPIVFPAAAQTACTQNVGCPSYQITLFSASGQNLDEHVILDSATPNSSFTFSDTFPLGITVNAGIVAQCLDANFVPIYSNALTCSVVVSNPSAPPTTPFIMIHPFDTPSGVAVQAGTVYADIGYQQSVPYLPNPPLSSYTIQATDLINGATGNKTFTINNLPAATAQGITEIFWQPLTGLTGSKYNFQVLATSTAGSSAYSTGFWLPDTGSTVNSSVWIANAPATPVLNSVVPSTSADGQLNLNATIFAGSRPTDAIVYFYTSNPAQPTASATISIPNGSPDAWSYSLSGLTDSTAYSVYVITHNAFGFSARSNVLIATPARPPAVPAAPTNLIGTALGSTEISVSFVAPTNVNPALQDYKVTYSAPNATPPIPAQFQFVTSNFPFVLNGLNPLTTYTISMQGENQLGLGAASNAITVATQSDTVKPVTPVLNSVLLTSSNGIAEVQVNFTAVANASSYTAYFTPGTISATLLTQQVSGTTGPLTITQSSLQSGELYHVSIVASNSAGTSARSTPILLIISMIDNGSH